MNESRLTTIAQIEEFLSASASIKFKPDAGGDCERYAHISAVLRRFDYHKTVLTPSNRAALHLLSSLDLPP